MTTINLKDFYAWYTHDEYIEVPDEVAEELKADKRYEAAYRRRVTRNKAQYSLDCDDGIEYSACLHEPSPEELVLRSERFFYLWNALNTLPEMQGRRVEACVIDGKSYAEVGAGLWHPSHSRHPAARRHHHPRTDQEQSGFPGMRTGGKRAVLYHFGQRQRRRADTQGRKGPLHHRGWDGVPGLPVR